MSKIKNFLVKIAGGMQDVIGWWVPEFDAMEELQDMVAKYSRATRESMLEQDKVANYSRATGEFMLEQDIKNLLKRVCAVLDLYCSEVSIQVSVYTGYHLTLLPI